MLQGHQHAIRNQHRHQHHPLILQEQDKFPL